MRPCIQRYLYVLLISLISCSVLPVLAQKSLLDKKIKIESQSGSVDFLLNEIAIKGGFSFTYSSKLPVNKYVKLKSKRQTIKSYLNELFNEENVKYFIKADKIVLIPSVMRNDQSFPSITGKIVDKLGVPILLFNDMEKRLFDKAKNYHKNCKI